MPLFKIFTPYYHYKRGDIIHYWNDNTCCPYKVIFFCEKICILKKVVYR